MGVIAIGATTGGAVSRVTRTRTIAKRITLALASVGTRRTGIHTRAVVLTLTSKIPRGTLTARRTAQNPFVLSLADARTVAGYITAVAIATALIRSALALNHAVHACVAVGALVAECARPKPFRGILVAETAGADALPVLATRGSGAVENIQSTGVHAPTKSGRCKKFGFGATVDKIVVGEGMREKWGHADPEGYVLRLHFIFYS